MFLFFTLFGSFWSGAVAGLADQPLQSLWSEESSLTDKAAGVVSGEGRGLLGVVTKPISGTAEFISQTGHGMSHQRNQNATKT